MPEPSSPVRAAKVAVVPDIDRSFLVEAGMLRASLERDLGGDPSAAERELASIGSLWCVMARRAFRAGLLALAADATGQARQCLHAVGLRRRARDVSVPHSGTLADWARSAEQNAHASPRGADLAHGAAAGAYGASRVDAADAALAQAAPRGGPDTGPTSAGQTSATGAPPPPTSAAPPATDGGGPPPQLSRDATGDPYPSGDEWLGEDVAGGDPDVVVAGEVLEAEPACPACGAALTPAGEGLPGGVCAGCGWASEGAAP